MERKVQVEVLHKHGEHVGKLVTQLTGKLTHLAHVLNAPPSPTVAQTVSLSAECVELARILSAETDFLRQRVHFFVADTKPSTDSP